MPTRRQVNEALAEEGRRAERKMMGRPLDGSRPEKPKEKKKKPAKNIKRLRKEIKQLRAVLVRLLHACDGAAVDHLTADEIVEFEAAREFAFSVVEPREK